ncbi:hypothetical protein BDF14DRAFT_1390827 [Spinellus fusiger]|nr:hypothetical protein BDF14DRAFT_1390827 [Spinellus fusiger]
MLGFLAFPTFFVVSSTGFLFTGALFSNFSLFSLHGLVPILALIDPTFSLSPHFTLDSKLFIPLFSFFVCIYQKRDRKKKEKERKNAHTAPFFVPKLQQPISLQNYTMNIESREHYTADNNKQSPIAFPFTHASILLQSLHVSTYDLVGKPFLDALVGEIAKNQTHWQSRA